MDGDGVSILPTLLHGASPPTVVTIVLDDQTDPFRVIAVWSEPAGVELQVCSYEGGEGAFSIEPFNGIAVAQDLGQKLSQLGCPTGRCPGRRRDVRAVRRIAPLLADCQHACSRSDGPWDGPFVCEQTIVSFCPCQKESVCTVSDMTARIFF